MGSGDEETRLLELRARGSAGSERRRSAVAEPANSHDAARARDQEVAFEVLEPDVRAHGEGADEPARAGVVELDRGSRPHGQASVRERGCSGPDTEVSKHGALLAEELDPGVRPRRDYAFALHFGPVTASRGWAAADLKLHGRTVRVVDTHLEAFAEAPRLVQASELLAGPAASPGPTILLGDFNSGPPAPLPTYNLLTGTFADIWSALGLGPGLNCCHDDLTSAIPYDQRVDLVLERNGISPLSARVIGDVPGASFPFFPSDHAGVVATVEID